VICDQVLEGALCGHEFLLAVQQVDAGACTILISGEDLTDRDLALERYDGVVAKPTTPFSLLECIESARRARRVQSAA